MDKRIYVCTVCGLRVADSIEDSKSCDCGGEWTGVTVLPAYELPEPDQSDSVSTGMRDLIATSVPVYLLPDPIKEIPPHKQQRVLADLRPGDGFTFIKYLPSKELELDCEYNIVPARRGRLSIANVRESKTYTFHLQACSLFPVKLLGEETLDHGRRFYKGDRVKHKTSGWKGVIVGPSGQGYYIKPDSVDTTEWVAPAEIRVIDRHKTVRTYVQQEDDKWFVRYNGLESNEFDSLCAAVKFLFEDNRCAFNRFSRLLAKATDIEPPKWEVSDDVIEYLTKQDPGVWRDPKLSGASKGAVGR